MKRRDFLIMTGTAAGAMAWHTLGRQASTLAVKPTPEVMPGLETFTASTCLMCPGGCGIKIRNVDDIPVGIGGNSNHPINAGGVCSQGIAAMQLLSHPDRLLHPMRRAGRRRSNPFEEVGWDAALDEIGHTMLELRKKGTPQKLAFLLGRTGGSMEELIRHFMSEFGSANLLVDEPQDGTAQVFEFMHGLRVQPAFDFDQADLVFSFGANLLEAWRSPLQFQRSYVSSDAPHRDSAGRFFMADTHFSSTAAQADDWIGISPGSYGALALGIAYVMLRERLYDAEFAAKHLYGFDDFRDARGEHHTGFRTLVTRDYSPEVVSRLTGVDVDRILELGKAFGESRAALALFDENVVAQPGGTHAAMAIHALNLLKGNLNRPGGIYLQPEVPLTPLTSRPKARQRDDGHLITEDLIGLVAEPDSIDILFLYYSNPVYSSSFGQKLKQTLDKIPLIISFSPFIDETSPFVDFMLPDATPMERWEDRLFPTSSPVPGWGIAPPVVKAAGKSRHSGEVLLELTQRFGPPMSAAFPWTSFEELLKYRARGLFEARAGTVSVDLFSQGLVKEMERRGWWISDASSFDSFWEQLLEFGAWTDPNYQVRQLEDYSGHPDGKIDLYCRSLVRRFSLSKTLLPDIDHLPHYHSGEEPVTTSAYPMMLKPTRMGKLEGGTSSSLPWILQGAGSQQQTHWNSWAEINAIDAQALGIGSHEWIIVESAAGKLRVQAVVYPGAAPGVVNIPFGFGHSAMGRWAEGRGVNPLSILVEERDPFSGLPYRFGTRVKIYKA